MAENKKSFLLYGDIIHTVKKMPLEKAGMLLMTILSYVNDEDPVVEDILVDVVFEPIKQQLKRDLVKYKSTQEKRSQIGSEGGKRSAEKRALQKVSQANKANAVNNKQNQPIASSVQANQPVSDNVNGNVSVNDNEIKNRANALVAAGATTEQKVRENKKSYKELVITLNGKDKKEVWAGLKNFISSDLPLIIDPYVDAWNIFAENYRLSKVETINESRNKKFKTRIEERAFDFLKILEKIKISNHLKGIDSTWKVSFDWIFENQSNYVKILEGNYE